MLWNTDDTLVEYFDPRIIFRLFTDHWSSVFISLLFSLISFHWIPIFGGLFRSICIMYRMYRFVYFLVILSKFVRWYFFSLQFLCSFSYSIHMTENLAPESSCQFGIHGAFSIPISCTIYIIHCTHSLHVGCYFKWIDMVNGIFCFCNGTHFGLSMWTVDTHLQTNHFHISYVCVFFSLSNGPWTVNLWIETDFCLWFSRFASNCIP